MSSTIFNLKGISDGSAFAPLLFLNSKHYDFSSYISADAQTERARFINARNEVMHEFMHIEQNTDNEQKDALMILRTYQMILNDCEFENGVFSCIDQLGMSALNALIKTSDDFIKMLDTLDAEYISARSEDIKFVIDKIAHNLLGFSTLEIKVSVPSIVVTDNVSPAELLKMDRENIKGFVLINGSANGHAAILLKAMMIPALIGGDEFALSNFDGEKALIYGDSGRLIINPDEADINAEIRNKEDSVSEQKQLYKRYAQLRKTIGNCAVKICANVGCIEELEEVNRINADGIGLFRSEFLYLRNDDFPTEDEQFECYKNIMVANKGRRVVIRTADLGSDKCIDYLQLRAEENPALGLRGLRYSFYNIIAFRTQIRALLRASAFGDLAIMFPMLNNVYEFLRAKTVVEEVKEELKSEGVSYNLNIEVGAMIETPSAAIMSKEIAKEADFLSIGSNDLTQYTLACDRNDDLNGYYDTKADAVIWLITYVVNNAKYAGKRVCLCGELASDIELSEKLLDIGIDELSVVPSAINRLRSRICEIWEK